MHVLMLGWEFPPFITGGLGTACHGLTRAMDARGMNVTFVLPHPMEEAGAQHVRLVAPGTSATGGASGETAGALTSDDVDIDAPAFQHVKFLGVAAAFRHPYAPDTAALPISASDLPAVGGSPLPTPSSGHGEALMSDAPPPDDLAEESPAPTAADYGGDVIQQVERYARFCLRAARDVPFDIIHAHDWMTYPAGLWIARATGRPLVVHVHSTEFDRSGETVNQRIYDIERRGMHGAMRVITVSQLTRNVVVQRYGVTEEHVEVVYNGVDLEPSSVGITGIERKDKIVLYFGRITFQKGPEYFIRAAMRVLEHMDDVKFVVAGSGDMARQMIQMAADLGIGHKVLFTGFLRGDDIKRIFALADLYVMPSVSEPFGIAPLEAIAHDVPVLISKSSGVSEVLSHALKVDFWDIDDMANKIIAVLRHQPLGQTLREHGAFEVRRLTWDGAAQRCAQVYDAAMRSMHEPDATTHVGS